VEQAFSPGTRCPASCSSNPKPAICTFWGGNKTRTHSENRPRPTSSLSFYYSFWQSAASQILCLPFIHLLSIEPTKSPLPSISVCVHIEAASD
jgi:hypothetical protein